jgi:hypothetical protein
MSSDYKQKSEEWFVQGFCAAQGGLAENICPYDLNESDGSAQLNWSDGWCFGRFVAVQKMRKDMIEQIKKAIRTIFAYQGEYADSCRIANTGLRKTGLKYFSEEKRSHAIACQIKQSKEFILLKELYIEVYLPCRPSEEPYTFMVFDRLMKVFGNNPDIERRMRKIVERYGERHGVKQAWSEYVYAEEIGEVVASALGAHT